MDRRQTTSIRGRVVALAAACILPMWMFVGYLSVSSFDSGRQELEQSLLNAAQIQMRTVEREIAAKEAALDALATSPNLDRHDYSAFQAQAEQVARHSAALNIVLLGARGEQLVNTLQPYGQPLPTEPPPFFAKVMESGRPVLSDLFIGPLTKRPLVSLSIPVPRDGRMTGILAVSLDAGQIAEFIRASNAPANWVWAIVDSAGTIVARRREPEKFVGRRAAPEALAAIAAAPRGVADITSLEGTHVFAAFCRSELYGWSFLVAVPRAELEAKLRRSLALSLAGGTGLFLFTTLAAWLLWRSFAASEKARERSRLLLQHASDGVHILDGDGNVLEASDSFCRMLGYDRDQVIGMNVTQWEAQMSPAECAAVFTRPIDPGEIVTFETRHRRRDGDVFDAEVSCHRLKLDGHTVLYGASRDITARKLAEVTLQTANRELEQFAYVASHDLREPLRMISSYISLLGRRYGDRLDADGHEFLEFAREGAQRMDRMVLDLLAFSRIGRMGDPFAELSLGEVVQAALINLTVAIAESAAEITVSPNPPTITGSHGELIRLIQNLIGNALKYRDPQRPPVIAVTFQRGRGEWQVAIKDNGIGIAPEYFERIFDIFQRLHTRDKYEGTGIGLAICRRIVEHHGGRIWVDSVPDSGSTFYFTLPDGGATT